MLYHILDVFHYLIKAKVIEKFIPQVARTKFGASAISTVMTT